MKIIEVIDSNQKKISIDIHAITEMMTTDMETGFDSYKLSDAEKEKLSNFKVEIVDSDNKPVDIAKLLDEAKSDPSKLPSAIDMTFEATHSGKNRNYMIYHSDSMEKDAASWMAPYAKPMLKNHDTEGEPLGRVKDFSFSQSDFNPERDCINVTYRLLDADTIQKALDGRYRTMSIGASVGHISCNICGKDVLKDGSFKFCGHWKGDSYGGQTALWNAKDLTYKEGSIVNCPADDWAQVKKITIVNSSSTKDSTTGKDSLNGGKGMDEELLNAIDGLTNTKDGVDPNTTVLPVTTPDPAVIPPTVNDSVDLATAKETITKLTAEKKTAEDKVTELNTQITTLTDEIKELKQTALVNDSEAKASRQQSTQIAVAYKKSMVQRIVDNECFNGKIAVADKETKTNELLAKSMKEVTDLVNTLTVSDLSGKVRDMAKPLVNPGKPNANDKNTITDDVDNVPVKKTIRDFQDAIVSVLIKK